jgi:hypothetical protein
VSPIHKNHLEVKLFFLLFEPVGTPVVGCPIISPKRFFQAFTVPDALSTSSAAAFGWMSQASWVYVYGLNPKFPIDFLKSICIHRQ